MWKSGRGGIKCFVILIWNKTSAGTPHWSVSSSLNPLWTAVCQPGCKHGDCVGPNKCKCHPGFTGKTCNQGECRVRLCHRALKLKHTFSTCHKNTLITTNFWLLFPMGLGLICIHSWVTWLSGFYRLRSAVTETRPLGERAKFFFILAVYMHDVMTHIELLLIET